MKVSFTHVSIQKQWQTHPSLLEFGMKRKTIYFPVRIKKTVEMYRVLLTNNIKWMLKKKSNGFVGSSANRDKLVYIKTNILSRNCLQQQLYLNSKSTHF